MEDARPRPVSPYYSQMSRTMAKQFNHILTGTTSPAKAVETLQSELQQIIKEDK
jgi:multiple sugar transport system substrate-binding protein